MNLKAVRGMHDLFGPELVAWKKVESRIHSILSAFGFDEIRTPVLEHVEVFKQSVGDDSEIVEKQMYEVLERGPTADGKAAEKLVLRPEGTAAFARAVLEHGLHRTGHIGRYYYSLPMFRHERPQKGRLRQFHQVGAEIINSTAPETDAELLVLIDHLFREIGIQEFTLRINSLGTAAARAQFAEALKKFMAPHLSSIDEVVRAKLQRAPLRILDTKDPSLLEIVRNAPTIGEFLEPQSRQHFETICSRLTALGVPFVIDPLIVRGLDYYSETAFEVTSNALGSQSALGAGGRYDGLAERFGASPIPGIGWAIGLERVMLVLGTQLATEAHGPLAFLAPIGPAAFELLLSKSLEMKKSGLRTEISYERDKGLKWHLKQADRLNAQWAILVGDSELSSGLAQAKNLRTGDQQTVPIDKIQDFLHQEFQKT